MVTLNQSLHRTSHYSLLMRKSAKLGFYEVKELIQLAAQRGCSHYSNVLDNGEVKDPGQDQLSDNELVILLLHGNNQYEPMAVRCAAQLLKSKFIDPLAVTKLAVQERTEAQLHYIADVGDQYDTEARTHWREILDLLSPLRSSNIPDCVLPHKSRFMVNPGIQRGRKIAPFWLNPSEM